MPIDNLSKITSRSGINTTILLEAGNANVTGIVTAAGFDGPFTGGSGSDINAGVITAREGIFIDDSITHLGDPNTKIRFPDNDEISFETSGTSRIFVESGGDVGIGTTNPHKRLHVADYGTHGAIRIEGSGNGNRSGIEFYRETSAGVSKGGAAIWVESDTSNSHGKLRFGTASNASVQSQNTDMILDNNGRLGIGTTNPGALLTVYGSPAELRLQHTGNGSYSRLISDSSNQLKIYTGGGPHLGMIIDGSQNVGIGTDLTTTPSSTLTVAPYNSTSGRNISIYTNGSVGNKAGLFFNATSGTGNLAEIQAEYKGTNEGELVLSTSMQKRLTITKDGEVGIGITNPPEKFQVNNGNIAIIGGSYKIDTHPLVSYANFVLDGGNYAARLGSTGTSTIRHTQIYGGGSHIATFDGVNKRLGIGTTNPSNALDVQGGTSNTAIVARSTDAKAQISLLDNTTTGVGCVVLGAVGDDLFLTSGSGGAEALRIGAGGTITTSYQIVSATAPDFPFVISQVDPSNTVNQLGGSGVGLIFSPATNSVAEVGAGIAAVKPGDSDGNSTADLVFYVSQDDETLDEALRITSNSKVGINSTSPSNTLVVSEPIAADNNPSIQLFRPSTGGDIANINWATNQGNQASINYRGGSGSEGLQFYTGGTGSSNLSAIIKTDGNVGIGTNDPACRMHLLAGNDRACVRLHNTYPTPDNVWELQPGISGITNTGFCIRDITDSANRLVISGIGQVGINTHDHADTASALTIMNGATNSEHSILDIRCDDNETSRVYFSEVSNSGKGSIRYSYTSDANFMSFYTNGTAASDEKLRIDSGGTLITGGHDENALAVHTGTSRGVNITQNGRVYCKTDDHWDLNHVGAGLLIRFRAGNDAGNTQVVVGNITLGTGSVAFNETQSDSRLKKNIEPWTDGVLQHFKTLQPKKFHFNWESDSDPIRTGYIAQDLVGAFPEAYPLCKTDIGESEEVDRHFFNPSGMVKYLMKALQEEIVKREALEARISALEGS